MGADVAKGVVVEEVGDAARPSLAGDVVAVDGALLGRVVLCFLHRHTAVDVEGGLVDNGGVVLSWGGLVHSSLLQRLHPCAKVDRFNCQALHHLIQIHSK